MKKSAPFTRNLAVILAVTLLQASTAWAIPPVPGSLAVLEPPMSLPEMRAAWDGIRNEIYLDPLLLTRGREEVLNELEQWRKAAESVRSAYQTADRITLDRTQILIDKAWSSYYRFEYDQAALALREAEDLLLTPGDSGFRTRLMFEVLLLRGITARAAGNKGYKVDFMLAAALDPVRELSSEVYSPATVAIYSRLSRELQTGKRISLSLGGSPADAAVKVGGGEVGQILPDPGYLVWPGRHFIEASAPGYEPWGLTFEAKKYEPANVRFQLVPTGPEGDPDKFFLGRLIAGDMPYLVLLAEKLNVDYLLLPDPQENSLKAWLIDGEGRTVDHIVLWEMGDTREVGSLRVSKLLEPLRQEWDHSRSTAGAPLSLPAISQDPTGDPGAETKGVAWKSYALVIGALLLLGAAGDKGGGTRIEATW